jgi:DNA-binding LacI/PurR family transcriptional regulator
LKLNQSRLIGYGWHNAEDPIRRNALLDRFLYDIAQAAEARGYHILTFAQADERSVASYEELIQMARVDGFVISDVAYDDARVAYLLAAGVPFVTFGQIDGGRFPSVDIDGRLGMRLVVEHLVALGHRRIALLNWPAGMRIGDRRTQGYSDALAAASLQPREEWIGRTRNTLEESQLATRQLLALRPQPTAIVCANDVMALGVVRSLEQAGLRIGDDIAVAGYDDTPVAELLGLTSVRQPIDVAAAKVVVLLLAEIGGTPAAQRSILLEPSLMVRASSGGVR